MCVSFSIAPLSLATAALVIIQSDSKACTLTCPVVFLPTRCSDTVPVICVLWFTRSDVRVVVDVLVPTVNASNGVFVAARVDQGGCTSFLARGVFFFVLFRQRQVVIATDLGKYHTVSLTCM